MDNDAILALEYDGVRVDALAAHLRVPHVVAYQQISSTLDAAHRLAGDGAVSGTLVIADTQTAGRGRNGRSWSSPDGAGIWLTLIERPADRRALDVMSLRAGLAVARALDPFASEPARLKWPNDVYIDGRKVAGILVEARWRDERLEWIALGIGVNLIAPKDQTQAGGLELGVRRTDVLASLMTELREIASQPGVLSIDELEEYGGRDLARGKTCVEPARGRVRGITERGELLVELADAIIPVRSGSLVLE